MMFSYHSILVLVFKGFIQPTENEIMTIRYEANPPKILSETDANESISKFVDKIKIISKKCDSIHLTENVLGFRRVSPIIVGEIIKKEIPDLPITVSLRVRDKQEEEILEFVEKCVNLRFDGILVLMGDPSQEGKKDSGQIPSAVVKRLNAQGIGKKIDLYLSISNKPDFEKIGKKIAAKPRGFMTQVVQNTEQVRILAENLKEFNVIPIILFPSEKNEKSAKFLKLDLAEYSSNFDEFVKDAQKITGDILLTSPSDFYGLNSFLDKLSS